MDDLSFEVVAYFKNKNRENFNVSYRIKFPNVGKITNSDYYDIIDNVDWVLDTPSGIINEAYYDADEMIGAYYAQTKWEYKKLEVIAGLRYEYTKLHYHMHSENLVVAQDGSKIYYDYLPNINLKYAYNNKTNIRASYYKSLNRQGFFEIIPYEKESEEEGYNEFGNPDLKHSLIDNVDMRWEYFHRPTEQILIGAFYKHLQNPIEMAYTSINNRQYGYRPENLGNAQNFGGEIDFIKYVKLFGIKANYTYTHSVITTTKMVYAKDENGNYFTSSKYQSRPLVGQAAHVANLSLLYKNVNHGLDAQIALTYIGDKIVIASNYYNSDYWQKGNFQLGVSAEKKFRNGLSLFVKANDLLTTPIVRFTKTANSYNDSFPLQSSNNGETIIRKDYITPSLLAGIRFKLP
ncbi:MAG: TonB-dependent receptor [Paludibacteraceae bacterium]